VTDKTGFEIHGIFYPYIAPGDWVNQDYILAAELTHVDPLDLLSPHADAYMLTIALEAVAIRHEKPELSISQIIDYMNGLKPNDAKQLGFEVESADPPAEGEEEDDPTSNSSSPTSNGSTESTPESSKTDSSGIPGSVTGTPA
jgi:hypothetical protein